MYGPTLLAAPRRVCYHQISGALADHSPNANMSINVLPENVTKKIAAGEVIERPASVVKELVENSIDAGADRVTVELEDGGAKLIRVVDNGCGMTKEDLALAFVSHATSKIDDEKDLFSVSTMGFRGEALCSVGAVSKATIVSRPPDQDEGYRVDAEGGVIGQVRATGAPVGTQVEVRNLFYNVPVRKKFLKTTATEMAHISEAVTRLALAEPKIQFILRHNDRKVFNLPKAEDRAQRIGEFFGKEIAENLIPVSHASEELEIDGYLLPPSIDRSNTKMQYTYVNGRYIRDRSLTHAIMQAYRGLLQSKRKPVCFIFIHVPPSEVDVNVHPTKTEVKFRKPRAVHNQLVHALKSTLREAKLTPQLSLSSEPPQESSGTRETRGNVEKAIWDFFGDQSSDSTSVKPVSGGGRNRGSAGEGAAPRRPQQPPPQRTYVQQGNLVQVLDSYIIEETEEGLKLIDQHALHERILYNEMKERLEEGTLNSQRLLIPQLVELPRQEFYAVMDMQEQLASLGVEIESFGESTVIVRSYPQLLERFDAESFLRDMLSEFDEPGQTDKLEERFEALLKVMACKGAVKAGQRLNAKQIQEILRRRDSAGQVDTCPHGRPTTILLSRKELESQFGRT